MASSQALRSTATCLATIHAVPLGHDGGKTLNVRAEATRDPREVERPGAQDNGACDCPTRAARLVGLPLEELGITLVRMV